jgi:hypothetical protein
MFVSVANKYFLFYFETAITHHSVLSFFAITQKPLPRRGLFFCKVKREN